MSYDFRDVNSIIRFQIKDIIKPRTSIYIMTIGVVNELRGKGISNLMIDHLKELAIFNK